MIRLVALACGLLCGAGFVLSGLHDPALLSHFLQPQVPGSLSLGIGLLVAILVAVLVTAFAGRRDTPILGGAPEPAPGKSGGKAIAGALLFGLGWGLAGYVPMAAMAAAGAFSPGAPLFLVAVLAGMILHDLPTGGIRRSTGGRGSFG